MTKSILALSALLLLSPFSSFAKPAASAGQAPAIKVTIAGFEPAKVEVKAGQDARLDVTLTTEATCATEIVIPKLKVRRELKLNKTESIALGKLAKGSYPFGCGMAMMIKGEIVVK